MRSKKPAFARKAVVTEMSSDVFCGRASELHPLCRLHEAQTYLSRLVATSRRVRQCSPLSLVFNFLALLGTSRDEGSNSAVSSPQVSLSSLDGEHPCPQVSLSCLEGKHPSSQSLFFSEGHVLSLNQHFLLPAAREHYIRMWLFSFFLSASFFVSLFLSPLHLYSNKDLWVLSILNQANVTYFGLGLF